MMHNWILISIGILNLLSFFLLDLSKKLLKIKWVYKNDALTILKLLRVLKNERFLSLNPNAAPFLEWAVAFIGQPRSRLADLSPWSMHGSRCWVLRFHHSQDLALGSSPIVRFSHLGYGGLPIQFGWHHWFWWRGNGYRF